MPFQRRPLKHHLVQQDLEGLHPTQHLLSFSVIIKMNNVEDESDAVTGMTRIDGRLLFIRLSLFPFLKVASTPLPRPC